MARSSGRKGSYSQLQHMRARLRKASCMAAMDDDSCGDDKEDADMDQSNGGEVAIIDDDITTTTSSSTANKHRQDPSPQPASNANAPDPSAQLQSAFFTHLPPELRRICYTHLYAATNPLSKMHLHASCDSARLTTTPCVYTPQTLFSSTLEDERDPMSMDPWPGWGLAGVDAAAAAAAAAATATAGNSHANTTMTTKATQPPRWFWHAWSLRVRWRGHWKCQAEAMMQWKARADGTCEDLRAKERDGVAREGCQGTGWMGLFLSCRRMYTEAIETLFESTELVFTASEDAYRFFVANPHTHVSRVRRLSFAFNHFKDHLFLQPIQAKHPRLTNGGGQPAVAPVSWELWTPLMATVRDKMPELRYLRVHLSPPSETNMDLVKVLDDWESLGYGWLAEQEDGVLYYEYRRQTLSESERLGISSAMVAGD